MSRFLSLSSLMLTPACFLGCLEKTGPVAVDHVDPAKREVLVSLSTADKEIVRADNGFGWRLFSRLAAADPQGNLFVSPLSVSIAMTMAYNGAGGATEIALREALGYAAMDRADINKLYAKLIPALTGADPKVTFTVANSIWSDPSLAVEPDFLASNRDNFGAETRTLDFSSPEAPSILNHWVSDKTLTLIPTIVDEHQPIGPGTVMMLLNALYFKGDWSLSFDTEKTFDGTFHKSDGSTAACRMMSAETTFRYLETPAVHGLELPYGDSLFSMVLLQPVDPAGLPGVIEALSTGVLEGWMGGFAERRIVINIPKFKIEWDKSIGEELAALGMAVAFTDQADFTGIRRSGGLSISKVIHKTFINVDEKGTTAAAVTRVDVRDTAALIDYFTLDRPFVFAIREKNSGAILFAGRVMEPKL
jgi:serine protease inhibitor